MRICLALLLGVLSTFGQAEVSTLDDRGNRLTLATPAQRIISLAPHTTELLFAAGAGAQVVGVTEYSNYPEAAKAIPRLGGYQQVDLERLLGLHPDLVVAWEGGNGSPQIERLRNLGLTVYVSDAATLEAIADSITRLGILAGSSVQARQVATTYRNRLAALRARYSQQPSYTLFYQIWDSPIMSIGNDALIAQIFPLCGAQNVFAELEGGNPVVSREAVLVANPQVILASGMQEERPDWLDSWRHWEQLDAVANERLLFIPPDLLQRPTPRLLDGAEQLCRALEQFRQAEGLQ